jgi:hypothetical protein
MADDDDPGLSAPEAFERVGHDVRLGIIRELDRVRRTNWQWAGLTFAELRRAVGVRDAGNFNYHLDKLVGTFVVKDDEEYKLTNAGMELVGAVLSGTVAERAEPVTEDLATTCPGCGEALTVEYDEEFLSLSCEEHGLLFGTTMPPGAVRDRTPEEMVRLATMDARQDVERARTGACPHCWGPMGVSLDPDEIVDPTSGERTTVPDDQVWAEFECDRCGMQFWLPPGACVVDAPPVVAFYEDHGVDVRDLAFTELPLSMADRGDVDGSDPLRVTVDVERDDERLTLWLDDDLEVVDHERA